MTQLELLDIFLETMNLCNKIINVIVIQFLFYEIDSWRSNNAQEQDCEHEFKELNMISLIQRL